MQYKENAKTIETLEREREREREVFSEINTKLNRLNKKVKIEKRIGYLVEVKEGRKRIKLLQDSLSFL